MVTPTRRLTDFPVAQRPRERLRRLGADALTDAEIVAVLIGSGQPGSNAIDQAQRVIDAVGGIAELSRATVDQLQRVPGIGPATASRVVAAGELRRRAAFAEPITAVSGTAGVAAAVLPHLQDRHRERLVVAVFDRRLRVVEVVSLPEGSTAHTSMPVADILQLVLVRGGQALALAHNHPSGSLDPSPADRLATEQLRSAADACGLRLLDHLVVAGDQWKAVE